MAIRIQPNEVQIPSNDPFKYDLFDRKESAEVLTHLINSFEGPCTMAVDAAWGNGKTTFLNLWARHLRNEGFPIIEFNAWETDFSDEPFVALSSELTEGLQVYADDSLEQNIVAIQEKTKEIIRRSAPGIVRAVVASVPGLPASLAEGAEQILASYAEDRLASYEKVRRSIEAFRATLQDTSEYLSEKEGRPTVVMIDELDRCRPSYAVQLLEVAKHLFSVEHVVFVLAINRGQLTHSIKALYGSDFDAEDYLRRFFDLDFRLPEPERERFISAMLRRVKVDEYFNRTKDKRAQGDYETVQKWLQVFFGTSDMSLRQIAQAIHRFGLVLYSLCNNQRAFTLPTVVILILRTINSNLYHQFFHGGASDLDIVDAIFSRPEAKSLQKGEMGQVLEALIIVMGQKVSNTVRGGFEDLDSPLFQRYRKLIEEKKYDEREQYGHAEKVIDIAQEYWNAPVLDSWYEFFHSVERIELLSGSLLEDSQESA